MTRSTRLTRASLLVRHFAWDALNNEPDYELHPADCPRNIANITAKIFENYNSFRYVLATTIKRLMNKYISDASGPIIVRNGRMSSGTRLSQKRTLGYLIGVTSCHKVWGGGRRGERRVESVFVWFCRPRPQHRPRMSSRRCSVDMENEPDALEWSPMCFSYVSVFFEVSKIAQRAKWLLKCLIRVHKSNFTNVLLEFLIGRSAVALTAHSHSTDMSSKERLVDLKPSYVLFWTSRNWHKYNMQKALVSTRFHSVLNCSKRVFSCDCVCAFTSAQSRCIPHTCCSHTMSLTKPYSPYVIICELMRSAFDQRRHKSDICKARNEQHTLQYRESEWLDKEVYETGSTVYMLAPNVRLCW